MAPAIEVGGAVSLYMHPKGAVVVSFARYIAKDGAFEGLVHNQDQRMPATDDNWSIGAAVRTAISACQ